MLTHRPPNKGLTALATYAHRGAAPRPLAPSPPAKAKAAAKGGRPKKNAT